MKTKEIPKYVTALLMLSALIVLPLVLYIPARQPGDGHFGSDRHLLRLCHRIPYALHPPCPAAMQRAGYSL